MSGNKFITFSFVILYLVLESQCEYYIENFQKDVNLSSWREHSDTFVPEGRSKATLVMQKVGKDHRAIFFTLLNPQSCGAALAGMTKDVSLDISKYRNISLSIRGQGQFNGYELILRHKGANGDNKYPSYVTYFEAPAEFSIISLPIDGFKPYLMGKLVENAEPLEKTKITSIGILAYGGAHLTHKQAGAAALEIDWIKVH